MEKLRQEIEITLALAIEEIYAFTALEFQNRVLAFLYGPGQEQMLTWGVHHGHPS